MQPGLPVPSSIGTYCAGFTHGALAEKPGGGLLTHSDQGVQFTRCEWAAFLREHNLEHSMGHRGNCRDNAVAENSSNS